LFFKSLKSLFYIFIFSTSLYSKDLRPVTIQLSWFDQFQFAGYYMAKEKGFYKDLGLDVTIKPFEFGIDIPKEVSLGNIDFAVGRETLLLERKKEQKIVALYALFQATPLVLLSTKESKINSVKDFDNKTIMTTIDDASEVSLKSMISSNNVNFDKLNFIKHTHNISDLLNKKTDVISAYLSKAPFELKEKNIEYNVFDPKDYGFDMYSDFLFTSEKLIKSDSEIVDSFKTASLKGWEYAYSNIEESSNVIRKKYNSLKLSQEALIYEAQVLKELSYFNTSILGEIKKEKIQRIYDLYNVMGLTNKNILVDDFIYHDKAIYNLKFSQHENEYIKSKKLLKACLVSELMPYSDFKDGKLIGATSDLINLIEEKLGIVIFKVKTDSYTESLEYIKSKKCDFIPNIVKTEKIGDIINFTESYNNLPYVLVSKTSVPFFSDIREIRNKRIAVVKDYAIFDVIKDKYKNIELIGVSNLNEGLQKVRDGEVYGYIGSNATSWFKLEHNRMHDLKISAKLNELSDVSMGINKDDILLTSILDKIVKSIDKETKYIVSDKLLAENIIESKVSNKNLSSKIPNSFLIFIPLEPVVIIDNGCLH